MESNTNEKRGIMNYRRFFTFEPISGDKIVLRGREFYHATKVLRIRSGHKIIINNNTDIDYYCTVVIIHKDYLIAKIDDKKVNEAYDDTSIVLNIALCKDFDTVVQKAVELGVEEIIPFTSQHTNIDKLNYNRMEKIILESSKQCERSKLMEVSGIITFEQAVFQSLCYDEVLFFYEKERENKVSNTNLLNKKEIAIFIGSEGGFSAEEVSFLTSKGINSYTLGKRVLRVSTAVVSAVTLCLQGMKKL